MLFSISCFSQNDNRYKIDKEINVNFISFEKTTGPIYRPEKFHILTEVYMVFRKDSCFVSTKFTDDKEKLVNEEDLLNPKYYGAYDFAISKVQFFETVNQLKNINFEAFEKDNYNVFDGNTYTIKFGNYNYNVNFSYHALDFNENDKNAKMLLKLFEEIWILAQNNSKSSPILKR